MSRGRTVGFTLIEVLVGMTVAAVALAAGFAALSFVQDRAGQAEAAMVPAISGAATRALLSEWLAGARMQAPGRGDRFQGLDSDASETGSDELIVPTTARTPLSVGTTVVRLYIDREDSTAELGLVAELTERPGDLPERLELLGQASDMELRYLPDVADATEWLDEWVDSRSLPLAVEITLSATPPDSLPTLLRYPLRVPLEAAR